MKSSEKSMCFDKTKAWREKKNQLMEDEKLSSTSSTECVLNVKIHEQGVPNAFN